MDVTNPRFPRISSLSSIFKTSTIKITHGLVLNKSSLLNILIWLINLNDSNCLSV